MVRPPKKRSSRVSGPGLTPSPEIHVRARPPILLRIPELDAPNSTPVAGEVNHASLTPIGNVVSNLKFVIGASIEVDDYALEFNGSSFDPELKGAKRPTGVHDDPIVIHPSIHIGSPEIFPSALVGPTAIVVSPLGG